MTVKVLLLAGVASLVLASPSAAHAASCGSSHSWVEDRGGHVMHFTHLTAQRGMNCPSARYALGRLKAFYARHWDNALPLAFWDGYVTWYCGATHGYRFRCHEHSSGTAFAVGLHYAGIDYSGD